MKCNNCKEMARFVCGYCPNAAPFCGRTKCHRVGKPVSATKARKILRHGYVRGKKLTAKQRRYFGWIAGGQRYGGIVIYEDPIALLSNYHSKENTRRAILILHSALLPNQNKVIQVVFDSCTTLPPHEPKTARVNHTRILVCDDIRTEEFQFTSPIPGVPHYAVIILHEFGHILDRYGKLNSYPSHLTKEEKANHFAIRYITKGTI